MKPFIALWTGLTLGLGAPAPVDPDPGTLRELQVVPVPTWKVSSSR
jgi:hypothetical protein